ncbi:hypothetical protein STCU_02330 [Strigomonas culicis]|uniref:rRNA biogenesis protein RRP36 n=1 Tax=Strigomonas culicis TaxID=28005 RepID=S9UWP3_9TRYP|nr:hypothetical protein STCU_02330 [Strigomonas culicis]|eukprot:EPY33298.1 hypothetical protein STCU_02330 [Strigomonas culicis]
MYGPVDTKQFEANYKFLREEQEEEEKRRRFRMACLRAMVRRIELEDAVYKGELDAAEFEEYDLSDNERDIFGKDHMDELAELKRTPPQFIYTELEQLQRQSLLHQSRSKGGAVLSRKDKVKKELMKKEVQQVKEGVKQKPFFPKRSAVKRALIADTYDRVEAKGGKGAVEKYLNRKSRRHQAE